MLFLLVRCAICDTRSAGVYTKKAAFAAFFVYAAGFFGADICRGRCGGMAPALGVGAYLRSK